MLLDPLSRCRWINYQREKKPAHYKALSLVSLDGLDPTDIFAYAP